MRGAVIIAMYVVGIAVILAFGLSGAPPRLATPTIGIAGGVILILLVMAGLCPLHRRRPKLARRAHLIALFCALGMLISMTALATIGYKQAADLHVIEEEEQAIEPTPDPTPLSNAMFGAAAYSSLCSLALFVTIPKPRRNPTSD